MELTYPEHDSIRMALVARHHVRRPIDRDHAQHAPDRPNDLHEVKPKVVVIRIGYDDQERDAQVDAQSRDEHLGAADGARRGEAKYGEARRGEVR